MPLFMDVQHRAAGLTPRQIAAAFERGRTLQASHGAHFVRYWYDTTDGKVFCLIEAPTRDAAAGARRAATGTAPEPIYEVRQGPDGRGGPAAHEEGGAR